MTDDVALGVRATRAGTRIGAFTVDARLLRWTVGIDDTLGPAVRWHADVARDALARWRVGVGATQRIRTTWRWYAWIAGPFVSVLFNGNGLTASERIASLAWLATADRTVVEHFAASTAAASAATRIDALLIDARMRWRTLGADDAFGSTLRRCADVSLDARANGVLVDVATLAVWSARRWRAHVYRLMFNDGDATVGEWIASVSGEARANRYVIDHLALCILAARARTWIDTFATQTCSIAVALGIGGALGATAFVRVALIFGDASALAAQTIGIRSTW